LLWAFGRKSDQVKRDAGIVAGFADLRKKRRHAKMGQKFQEGTAVEEIMG
jgi:hypothetical protein